MDKSIYIESSLFHNRDRSQWNRAASQLRLYLRQLGIRDELSLAALETKILLRAMLQHDAEPNGSTPLVLTLRCVQQLLSEWLGQALPESEQSHEQFFSEGITSLRLSRLMNEDRDGILSVAPSEVVKESLRRNTSQACPELSVSNMTARAVDYGPLVNVEPDQRGEWTPIFLTLSFWATIYVIGYSFLV